MQNESVRESAAGAPGHAAGDARGGGGLGRLRHTYQERPVGPCCVCGRPLLGREAGTLPGVVYCLPRTVWDAAGAYSHTDAACADEAERRVRAARTRGMAGSLL